GPGGRRRHGRGTCEAEAGQDVRGGRDVLPGGHDADVDGGLGGRARPCRRRARSPPRGTPAARGVTPRATPRTGRARQGRGPRRRPVTGAPAFGRHAPATRYGPAAPPPAGRAGGPSPA